MLVNPAMKLFLSVNNQRGPTKVPKLKQIVAKRNERFFIQVDIVKGGLVNEATANALLCLGKFEENEITDRRIGQKVVSLYEVPQNFIKPLLSGQLRQLYFFTIYHQIGSRKLTRWQKPNRK